MIRIASETTTGSVYMRIGVVHWCCTIGVIQGLYIKLFTGRRDHRAVGWISSGGWDKVKMSSFHMIATQQD